MGPVEDLYEILTSSRAWPPDSERAAWESASRWAAFREADGEALKPADWDTDQTDDSTERRYLVDPLAGRISGAFADLIFGQEPVFTAAQESDQEALDAVIAANNLPSALQSAEDVCCSEGEVWWRAYPDETYPCIQWLSRAFVIPLFRGRRLLAAAFVSELPGRDREVFRHIEIQAERQVRNYLFRANRDGAGLGERVELDAHPDTAALEEEWRHDFAAMFCGRIVNREGIDPHLGVSQLKPIRDHLYALNEALTIGTENVRLTAKQRVVVPSRFLDAKGNLPSGAEVIIASDIDQNPDKPSEGMSQIEWSFDSTALEVWMQAEEERALTRARCAPQLVGKNTEGAQTGPALRARLLDSILAAHGMARYWDDELPKALLAAQLIDSEVLGGNWSEPRVAPAVQRRSILPEDETEEANRHGALVGSLLESRWSAIRALHPEWDDQDVDAEMERIAQENPLPVVEPSQNF